MGWGDNRTIPNTKRKPPTKKRSHMLASTRSSSPVSSWVTVSLRFWKGSEGGRHVKMTLPFGFALTFRFLGARGAARGERNDELAKLSGVLAH